MFFSPSLYHWFIRPKWSTRKYIHNPLAKHFNLTDQNVLDFGSGTGANCSLFEPTRYVGIDPDEERVQYAAKRYPTHRFLPFNCKELPLEDDSLDLVLIVAVLHHISSQQISEYIQEFRRVLKPKGMVIAMEPCLCADHLLCNEFMKWYDNGDYIRNEQEYYQLFEAGDFQCVPVDQFRKCMLYNELLFQAHL